MRPTAQVLTPGDWVNYDGGEHQVVALAGTSVRLRAATGGESIVLVSYLMASPGFGLVDGAPAPSVEPFGLLEGLPLQVRESALLWRRHVEEVETGRAPGVDPDMPPRPEYDTATSTLAQRE